MNLTSSFIDSLLFSSDVLSVENKSIVSVISVASVCSDFSVIEEHLYHSLESVELPISRYILDNVGNKVTNNIASLYNMFLRLEGPDLCAFLHPDVSFEKTFFDDIFLTLNHLNHLNIPWGAIGIVGRTWDGSYVWCHDVDEPTPVCTLDCCSLITARSKGLMFDYKRFNEFHCYVEDYCLQCHSKNLGVFVFPTSAHHGSATKKVRGSAWGRYAFYWWLLKFKWWRKYKNFYTC